MILCDTGLLCIDGSSRNWNIGRSSIALDVDIDIGVRSVFGQVLCSEAKRRI